MIILSFIQLFIIHAYSETIILKTSSPEYKKGQVIKDDFIILKKGELKILHKKGGVKNIVAPFEGQIQFKDEKKRSSYFSLAKALFNQKGKTDSLGTMRSDIPNLESQEIYHFPLGISGNYCLPQNLKINIIKPKDFSGTVIFLDKKKKNTKTLSWTKKESTKELIIPSGQYLVKFSDKRFFVSFHQLNDTIDVLQQLSKYECNFQANLFLEKLSDD